MKRNMRSAQAIQNMFDDRVSRLIESVGANVSGKKTKECSNTEENSTDEILSSIAF